MTEKEDEEPPFVDIPERLFPMKMEFYDVRSKEVYNTIHMEGPGVLSIPPCKNFGIPPGFSGVRITYGDGTVVDEE